MVDNDDVPVDRRRLADAIRSSWCRETSAEPEAWSEDNPAKGQCDVSSFVAWEHLGGDLVLSQVFADGELQEHHYWNRIEGVDLDLTREQFTGMEQIDELHVLTAADVEEKSAELRPELVTRLDLFRARVGGQLAS